MQSDIFEHIENVSTMGKRAQGFALAYNQIADNHNWHVSYDDHDGYAGSNLEDGNIQAMYFLSKLVHEYKHSDGDFKIPDWVLVIFGMMLWYVASMIVSTDFWHMLFGG